MPVAITILTIPSGSILTSAIVGDEKESKNDFKVRIVLDENGTGLTESDITFSTGASLVELTGERSVWEATIRPPETAAVITLTIAADAFSEGNAETSKDIRVSRNFPDADAEVPTQLSTTGGAGISTTRNRIVTTSLSVRTWTFHFFTADGTEQTAEQRTIGVPSVGEGSLDIINGDVIGELFNGNMRRYLLSDLSQVDADISFPLWEVICHTRLGFVGINYASISTLRSRSYDHSTDTTYPLPSGFTQLAHQTDLLYLFRDFSANTWGLAEITAENTIEFSTYLNISRDTFDDIAIREDTLYAIKSNSIHTLDIRPYRPITRNTKTTIYPVFATNGDTLPLSQFCPDGKDFAFSVGFDKPTFLSINSSNEIAIASNAVSETTPVLVRVTGINYIDSVDFSFYLIIVPASAPTWRAVESLSMKANTTYDLHPIVDADSIAFEPGETQPTGSSLSDGVFTIATTAGTAYFRATKGGLTTDKAIQIDVIQAPNPDNFSDIFRYKVEIAGVDVTPDLLPNPPLRVSKSLDAVELTRYRAGSVSVPLRNNEGKYNPDLSDNFWSENSLNPGGYQEEIKIYRESFVDDAWLSTLLFVGIIENQGERFSAAQVTITAKDISVELERAFISDFGTLSKWAGLRQLSDEATYEGVYLPEGSLSPIQPKSGKAWSGRTALTLRRLQNPSKGPPLSNTGHLTTTDFRTSGGFLEDPPVLNFKAVPRSEDVRFLIEQSALTGAVYNTDIQLIDVELDDPTVFNRGSVPFSVEGTRITRLLTDWVHDATNDRLLILLSNPEGHIADLLAQYNVENDSHRVLHTFDKDISVHRITRRTSTDYYILSAKAISQDRSAARLPRPIDSTGYAYDSAAAESEIKILRYNASTDTLTEHVDEDDSRPPQLGIHYHVGFENTIYIDEFEGIVADYRGSFKF